MSAGVLVIVDEVEVRLLVGTVLQRAGYRVAMAASGEEGLARLETQSVDCLVVDKVLNGMHGAEVMAQARQRQPGLKVVLLSSQPEPLALGDTRPDVCLARPFATLAAIEEAVASALEAPPEPVSVSLRNRLARALKPRRGP